ncbi:MAG: hypothetical protein IT449_00245 [Phycisphaerales bacterium]|nr:hypothetical protein [Phycisphaerales bacterium]
MTSTLGASTRRLAILAVWTLGLLAASATACTVFLATDGKLVLGGDSEDWIDPNTQVWFIPATDKTFGVVYFGFGKGEYPEGGITLHKAELPPGGILNMQPSDAHGFPQAGINDRGLFFGGAATNSVKHVNPNGKEAFDGFIADHILRTCATVKEARVVLERYSVGLPQGQLLFGDRTGDSMIVEAGDVIIPKKGNHQVITNFKLSQMPNGGDKCARFKKVDTMFAAAPSISIDMVRDALQAVGLKPSPDGLEKRLPGTQYSIVFDLTHLELHVYRCFDFERPIRMDVRKELSRGARAIRLAEIVESAPANP